MSDLTADHTVRRDDASMMAGPNRFKLGVFGANASGGMGGMTFAEGQIRLGDWGGVRSLARKAEAIGIEAFIPIARWKTPSGPGRTRARQFETFTWAAGLADATERIHVFATCHVPFVHPIMAAKMCATVDHISGGRMGLNVVAGYNEPEFKMFGQALRPHDDRYAVADEWMKRLWSDEAEEYEFDFEGEHYVLHGAESAPKPVQTPYPLGDERRSQSARPPVRDGPRGHPLHGDPGRRQRPVAHRARPRRGGALRSRRARPVGDAAHRLQGHREGGSRLRPLLRRGEGGLGHSAHADGRAHRRRHAQPHQLQGQHHAAVPGPQSAMRFPVVGTPDQVVEQLQQLSDAGLDGAAVAMVDYEEGLDRLGEQILPLMRSAGLRVD